MNYNHKLIVLTCAGLLAFNANAQENADKVALHGSIQSDVLVPETDNKIGTGNYDGDFLTNTYLDLNLTSKHVDAGARLEYLDHPLPGFEKDFKGWGVPHFYVKGKMKGADLTLGDFYDQFGSGFIFRTYEERSLGIDNALRGARLNVSAINGVNVKLLGGVQRRYWDWETDSKVLGADVEVGMEQFIPSLQNNGSVWMLGASYVLKHEKDENLMVAGTDQRLNLPLNVNAFDVRSTFQTGSYNFLAEYAWKSQDPSFDNGYTYGHGDALMLSASYSKKGVSALLQAKRSENMAFRSQRSMNGTGAMLNNMPAFAYQHTYALPALYPYATQAAGGEWAFQGEFAYLFPRRTALGGKYGTKLKLNVSHVRSLDSKPAEVNPTLGTTWGSNGSRSKFFNMGDETYYQDINVQMEKKMSKAFKLNLMYMNQRYNKTVVEGEGGMITSNIFVGEGKYQFNNQFTLRGELQYLTANNDQYDWAYGLLELSVAPHFMFTVSDMWNCGTTDLHYYMGSVTYNVGSHRIMAGYGRTRAGYNCSGGVCRFVPASRGVQLSYNYTF